MLLLRAERGKWGHVSLPDGPLYPAERIELERNARDRIKINSFLDYAHSLGEGVAS